MKVLLINGSPKANGNTNRALREVKESLEAEGVGAEIVQIGAKPIRGCLACNACKNIGKCVVDDMVNEVAPKFKEADGLVIGSPVYYASPAGTLVSFLDRLFYSTPFDKTMKVGAAVAVARRGGTTAAFDMMNKYFTITGMPIASSYYWNNVHGLTPGEAEQDLEGLLVMRELGRNMAFLMKAIALAKAQGLTPGPREERVATNFIR